MKADRVRSTGHTVPQIAQPLPSEFSEESKLPQEAVWVQQACQGDPNGLVNLYESYVGRVYNYFFGKFKSVPEAETLTSETFIRAIKAIAQGRYAWQGKPFGAWLFRIADNVRKEHIRQLQKTSGTQGLEDLPEHIESASKGNNPLEAFIQKEERDELWSLIGNLTPIEQRLLELRYVCDLSFAEIAEELGRSEAACKQLHYRTLQKLKQLMRNAGMEK